MHIWYKYKQKPEYYKTKDCQLLWYIIITILILNAGLPPIQQHKLQRAYVSPRLEFKTCHKTTHWPTKLLPKDFGDGVSVIDYSTKTVVATMPVGEFPENAIFNYVHGLCA